MTDREIYVALLAFKGECLAVTGLDCSNCPTKIQCRSIDGRDHSKWKEGMHQHAKDWLAKNPESISDSLSMGDLEFSDGPPYGTDIASNNSESSIVRCSCDSLTMSREGCKCGWMEIERGLR